MQSHSMNTLLTQFILLTSLIMNSSATTSTDLFVAIQEMQVANYFTFVTLINMSPLDHIVRSPSTNLTFLMPNDKILARTTIPDHSVSGFLNRHSIPSPMLLDYLLHIPNGSIIPSLEQDFMLKISNSGRKNYYLNNVKIISPNICTAGSSIRCHGIDGVLLVSQGNATNPILPTCSSTNSRTTSPASPVAVNQPPPQTLTLPPSPSPMGAPPSTGQNGHPQKSEASFVWWSSGGWLMAMGGLSLNLLVFS